MTDLPLIIELIEDDILLFSFVVAGNRVECLTNFIWQGSTLRLVRLHVEGTAQNQVGRASLWQIARQVGRHFGATTIIIEGGRRTTGRYKGQVPTPIIISILKT
ncbi:MAG: hypothetical protein EOO37_03360 [Cytophagaceae bacterium]|nr:MAG: hypothetical protein EOO37_03360 [Cytophagaceae bacterium]